MENKIIPVNTEIDGREINFELSVWYYIDSCEESEFAPSTSDIVIDSAEFYSEVTYYDEDKNECIEITSETDLKYIMSCLDVYSILMNEL